MTSTSEPSQRADFDRLFRMEEAIERGALRVHTGDTVLDAYALARGDWAPPGPLRYKRDEGGSKQHDMIGTTHGLVRLVSGRFVQALRDGGFTGWTTFPVAVTGKRGEPLDYHGWSVTGRAGAPDPALSERVMRPPPSPAGRPSEWLVGDFFHPETWDGTDVFLLGETVVTAVTQPVRDALEAAGVTGVEFEPLSRTERRPD